MVPLGAAATFGRAPPASAARPVAEGKAPHPLMRWRSRSPAGAPAGDGGGGARRLAPTRTGAIEYGDEGFPALAVVGLALMALGGSALVGRDDGRNDARTPDPVPAPVLAVDRPATAWSNDELVAQVASTPGHGGAATPAVPTRVVLPSIGVDAPVDPLGLAPDGTMAVPTDYARVGWYDGSAVPGDPGVSVLVGHLDDEDAPAVFYKLEQLKAGHPIDVPRSDGTVARYVVTEVKVHSKQRFPTERVFGNAAGPGLRLVTCIGRFDRKRRSYLDNLVVYASPAAAVAT